MAVHVHRSETTIWPVWLSLGLHLTLLLCFLMIPSTRPPTTASEPLTVDFIVGEGPAQATPGPPAPPEAPAAPDAPPTPPVQQAEVPAPAPDVLPPPPVQQAEIPAPAPDVLPPPPVQQAEIPPPTPAPAALPVPPPPAPVVQAHPPRAPPQRAAAARAPGNPAGAPAHAPAGQNAAGGASAANNGAAWMGKLKQWWDQHSVYPKEASQTNEGGNVRVHIVIAADGQVTSIEVVQSSGLSVLDAAAVAVFRNAHLPPFPPGSPAQPADVVVTLHYRPADSGG
jgi:protein TonB